MEKDENALQKDSPSPEKISGITNDRYLAFSLCDEEYAVPLLKVREVIAVTDFTSVPYTPPHFRGIMNLRGQVISIVDLRLKFKMKRADITPESAIIILDLNPICLGVVVDAVNSVLALSQSKISPSPDIESNIDTDYITGVARVEKKLILILDIDKTLNVHDLAAIRQGQKTRTAA